MVDATCPDVDALIDDLLDGTIAPDARARVEHHLARCPACRALADDLLAIREQARQLPLVRPPDAVWHRLADRLASERAPAAWSASAGWHPDWMAAWSPWRWALAAAALTAAAAAAAATVLSLASGPAPAEGPAEAADASLAVIDQVEADLVEAEQHYEAALRGLATLAAQADEGVAADAAMLRQHLMLLDRMIAESRAALRQQPGSTPAQRSLFEGLRRKFVLLQDAVALLDDLERRSGPGGAISPQ